MSTPDEEMNAFHFHDPRYAKEPVSERINSYDADTNCCCNDKDGTMTRRAAFLSSIAAASLYTTLELMISPASAFEGGIGGLGKTKPETGVRFLGESLPLQNAEGLVSAELDVGDATRGQRNPVRVVFTAPWPLLSSTSGLEARDLQHGESAFIQVVQASNKQLFEPQPSASAVRELLQASVLSQQGKFGAYGAPTDAKVKAIKEKDKTYSVTFTTLTPGLRESERQVLVKLAIVGQASILLVAGTTRQRFQAKQDIFMQIIDSFQVEPAPETKLR